MTNRTIERIQFANADVAIIREEDVRKCLTVDLAIADVRSALTAVARQLAINCPRVRVRSTSRDAAWLHTLRGGIGSWEVAGGKDYTSLGFDTPAMWTTIVDTRNGLPLAFIEADYLSRVRTAATTALATDLLAPLEVTCLVHFGAGKISELLVRGVLSVRPSIRKVLLVRRDASKGAPEWIKHLDGDVKRGLSDPVSALQEADIVTTATSSRTPIISAEAEMPRLRHINLVGSNHLKRREIPDGFARRCLPPEGYLVADDPSQAAIEAGDFAALAQSGALDWRQVPSLAQLVDDPGEREKASRARLTAFKSVGIGLMDLAISAGVLRRLRLLALPYNSSEAADQKE